MNTLPKNATEASRAVLLEAVHVLGAYRDALVIVGGWAPDLYFPGCGHVGSLDVDFAVDTRRIGPAAYDTLRQRLLDAGYRERVAGSGLFDRVVPGQGGMTVTVKLDLVTGEQELPISASPVGFAQGVHLGKLKGMELAFEHPVSIELAGTLPDGAHDLCRPLLVSLPSFLCMKCFALAERKKPKDAYDIAFCLEHAEGGAEGVAAQLAPLLGQPLVREALGLLRDKFARVDSVGPVWAGQVAEASGLDGARWQRAAFERVARMWPLLGI